MCWGWACSWLQSGWEARAGSQRKWPVEPDQMLTPCRTALFVAGGSRAEGGGQGGRCARVGYAGGQRLWSPLASGCSVEGVGFVGRGHIAPPACLAVHAWPLQHACAAAPTAVALPLPVAQVEGASPAKQPAAGKKGKKQQKKAAAAAPAAGDAPEAMQE